MIGHQGDEKKVGVGLGGDKKAKYVTIEQVASLEVGRQELINGLGKLLCLEILSLEGDL